MNLIALPAFTDNHIWMLHDGQRAVVVDPGESTPVIAAPDAQHPTLAAILVTHRRGDHGAGIEALRPGLRGAVDDAARDGIPEPMPVPAAFRPWKNKFR